MKVYEKMASLLAEYNKYIGENEQKRMLRRAIEEFVAEYMPKGGGWKDGTSIDLTESNDSEIVLRGTYYHVISYGNYGAPTEHKILIDASLSRGFKVKVTGRDKNDVKDELYERFVGALNTTLNGEKK
jgi:hypothetical protein